MSSRNPYTMAGLVSVLTGITVALLGQFIFLVAWITALGIALLILSFVFLVLGRTIPRLPPEYSRLLLETGLNNVTSMVEELGISSRAVYLPASMTGGQIRAWIPFRDDLTDVRQRVTLPDRMIVRYGNRPEEIGLLVTTVGTAAVKMLEQKPGDSLSELEDALTSLVSGILGVADGVTLSESQNQIMAGINKPRIEIDETWSDHCLGGPLASLVASVIVYGRDLPVQVVNEEKIGDRYRVEIQVLA